MISWRAIAVGIDRVARPTSSGSLAGPVINRDTEASQASWRAVAASITAPEPSTALPASPASTASGMSATTRGRPSRSVTSGAVLEAELVRCSIERGRHDLAAERVQRAFDLHPTACRRDGQRPARPARRSSSGNDSEAADSSRSACTETGQCAAAHDAVSGMPAMSPTRARSAARAAPRAEPPRISRSSTPTPEPDRPAAAPASVSTSSAMSCADHSATINAESMRSVIDRTPVRMRPLSTKGVTVTPRVAVSG